MPFSVRASYLLAAANVPPPALIGTLSFSPSSEWVSTNMQLPSPNTQLPHT